LELPGQGAAVIDNPGFRMQADLALTTRGLLGPVAWLTLLPMTFAPLPLPDVPFGRWPSALSCT
jgi:hypothetical protein